MVESDEKEMFGFRADNDLAQRIKQYMEAKGLSESDALRNLVREGLRVDDLEDRLDELSERLGAVEREVEDDSDDGFSLFG